MLVIPAIDILNGKCVRLFQGDFGKVTEYSDDPVQVAQRWADQGAKMLHVIDLDGAKAGQPASLAIVRRIASKTGLPVQLGGGLRTREHVESAFAAGAARAILGSAACDDPDMLRELVRLHADRIIVSIDCDRGVVMKDGWLRSSGIRARDLARRMLGLGIRTVIYTDVSCDGTLRGVNTDAIVELLSTGASVIAAGGVGSLDDLRRLKRLRQRGLSGAIIGRALYTGAIRFRDALRVAGSRRIIPCLDTKDGRVVKGVEFTRPKDAGDPLELAVAYQDEGADELALLDISATEEGRGTCLDAVRRISSAISIPLMAGGGIRSLGDTGRVLDAGAAKACIGTAAVQNPELVQAAARAYGSHRIVVAIDAAASPSENPNQGGWVVCVMGGRLPTQLDLVEWACEVERLGAGEILLTSIDQDGAADGYDLCQIRAVSQAVSIPVIASGGAGALEDFRMALVEGGADAALAASVFHFGLLRIGQVKDYLAKEGVDVRL